MVRFAIFLTALAMSLGQPLDAHAQVPSGLKGGWAKDECTPGNDYAMWFEWGELYLDAERVYLGLHDVVSFPRDPHWVKVRRSNPPIGQPDYVFFRMSGANSRDVAMRPPGDEGAIEEMGRPPESWPRERWVRCDLPQSSASLIIPEVFELLSRYDTFYAVCTADTTQCAEATFAFTDVTGNGTLSAAEIGRALRVLAIIAALADAGWEGVEQAEVASVYMTSMLIGAPIAQMLILAFDYDGSRELDLSEIMQDRERLLDPGVIATLSEGSALPDLEQQLEKGLFFLHGILQ